MAEAFAKSLGINAESAGTIPPASINPVVVEAMLEKGIDISHHVPKLLTVEMINRADLVITMGCSVEQVCPRPVLAKMQVKLIDWELEDPKDKPIGQVRIIRDEIEKRVAGLRML